MFGTGEIRTACPACVRYQFITASHGLFPNTWLAQSAAEEGRGEGATIQRLLATVGGSTSENTSASFRDTIQLVGPRCLNRFPHLPSILLRFDHRHTQHAHARAARTHVHTRARRSLLLGDVVRSGQPIGCKAIFGGSRSSLISVERAERESRSGRSATVEHVRPRSAGKCVREERETKGSREARGRRRGCERVDRESERESERERERERAGGEVERKNLLEKDAAIRMGGRTREKDGTTDARGDPEFIRGSVGWGSRQRRWTRAPSIIPCPSPR